MIALSHMASALTPLKGVSKQDCMVSHNDTEGTIKC